MSVPDRRAEQRPGADCFQRPLVPRFRFQQQLRPSVRLQTKGLHTNERKKLARVVPWRSNSGGNRYDILVIAAPPRSDLS